MSEKNNKNSSMVRIILCVIALIIIIISWLDIIPDKIGIILSVAALLIVTIWNGIEALGEGNKKSAIAKFVLSGILVILCAVTVIF